MWRSAATPPSSGRKIEDAGGSQAGAAYVFDETFRTPKPTATETPVTPTETPGPPTNTPVPPNDTLLPPPTPVGGIAFDPDLSALAVEAPPETEVTHLPENVASINYVRVFARVRAVAVAALGLAVTGALWWLRFRRT